MFVDDDSIINYRERKYKDNDKEIKDSERKSKKVVYINVRGRLCSATPPLVIVNRTPPSPSQKHHFTQKHQINFCIDDIHRADSQRRGVDIVL